MTFCDAVRGGLHLQFVEEDEGATMESKDCLCGSTKEVKGAA